MQCYVPIPASIAPFKHHKSGANYINILNKVQAVQKRGDKGLMLLRCGKCLACRTNSAQVWALRCMLEAKQYKHNQFITLTYDDQYVPTSVDKTTGEVRNTISKVDLTNFLDNLRKYYKRHYNHTGIRYYACGEYGTKTLRPHYHILLFNLPINDLVFYKRNFQKKAMYNSAIIHKLWGKGFVVIGSVSHLSAAYTARYSMKNLNTPQEDLFYTQSGLVKPYSVMSRMPGLGKAYYDKNKHKIYEQDKILIKTEDNRIVYVKPPKYFDTLYKEEFPARFKEIQDKRKNFMEENQDILLDKLDITLDEYHDAMVYSHKNKLKGLIREL